MNWLLSWRRALLPQAFVSGQCANFLDSPSALSPPTYLLPRCSCSFLYKAIVSYLEAALRGLLSAPSFPYGHTCSQLHLTSV
jgi:hypothetical protein